MKAKVVRIGSVYAIRLPRGVISRYSFRDEVAIVMKDAISLSAPADTLRKAGRKHLGEWLKRETTSCWTKRQSERRRLGAGTMAVVSHFLTDFVPLGAYRKRLTALATTTSPPCPWGSS